MKLSSVKLKHAASGALSSLFALVLAFVASGLFVMIAHVNPLVVFSSLFKGGLGSPLALAGTLNRMAPIMLAGIAITAGVSCGVFNLGFGGQFLIGMFCAAYATLAFPMLPGWLLCSLAFLAAMAGSMLWSLPAILLNLKRGIDVVFSCIMTNYVAQFLMNFLIGVMPGYISGAGTSPMVPKQAMLPYLIKNPQKVNSSVLVALICLVALYILLFKTRVGYEMRAVGLSRTAAYSAGISVPRQACFGMVLSAMFTGICAALEVMCITGCAVQNFAVTYLGLGIAVAMLGRSNPIMIFLSAFLFAAMKNGSTLMQMNTGLSAEFTMVIEGLIIIFIGMTRLFQYLAQKINERRVQKHA